MRFFQKKNSLNERWNKAEEPDPEVSETENEDEEDNRLLMETEIDESRLSFLQPEAEIENQKTGIPEDAKKGDLIIQFVMMPIVTKIDIFPLLDLSEGRIKSGLTLEKGQRYTKEIEDRTIQEIRDVAKENDINYVNVTTHHFSSKEGEIEIGYIVEGRSIVDLYKVRFKGAGFGNAVKIRGVLKDPEVLGFDQGSRVTAGRIKEIESLVGTEIMRSQGFLLATARLDRTEWTEKGAKVVYDIDRGPQYDIESITVNGQVFTEPDFWATIVAPFESRNLTSARVQEIEENVIRHTQKQGFIDPTVNVMMGPGEGENAVALTVNVDEGTEAVLGDVIINRGPGERGYGDSWYHKKIAPPLKEALISKQIRIRQGDDLNLKVLDDAERRLWRLGIFDEVEVSTEATTDTSVRNVVARVREKRTAGLGVSLGWNDDLGPVIRAQAIETNIGGRGDALGVSGFIGIQERAIGGTVSYFDRYWKPGEKFIGTEREPSMLYTALFDEYGYDEYVEQRLGGRMRLSYLVGENLDYWSNFWELRVERIRFEPFRPNSSYNEDFGDYLAKTLTYGIVYDNRDKGDYNDTEGWLASTQLEVGDADGLLVKWSNSAEYFKPLSKHFNYHLSANAGFLPTDADDIGLADRFQNGGLYSIRGFETRGIGPVDGQQNDLHTGGPAYFSLKMLLSLPQ